MFKTILFFILLSLSSAYASQSLVWGIDQELSPIIKITHKVQKAIEDKTQGRVKLIVKTYDSDKIKNEFHSIKNDVFQIHQMEVDEYYNNHPELKFWDIPFVFLDKKHVESYIESARTQKVLESVEDKYRKHISYSYAGGFLFMFTQKAINSMTDLIGVECESDGGGDEMFNNYLASFGIGRTPENARGDQCAEILSSDLSFVFSELEKGNYKHITYTRHRILPRIISISKKALKDMRISDQRIVINELKKFSKLERESIYKGVEDLKKILAIRNLNFKEWSISQRKSERDRFLKLGQNYIKKLGSRANQELEHINGLVDIVFSQKLSNRD